MTLKNKCLFLTAKEIFFKKSPLIKTAAVCFWLYLILAKSVSAEEDLSWAANKYGIHVNSSFEDLPKAAQMLNSNGGDWGWLTVVIRQDELNQQQWQDFFNLCRRLHLIPIVRLATEPENGYWKKPNQETTKKAAEFLNSLNWPIKPRFVVVYNEPNRGDEWGGASDPKEYFELLELTSDYFHNLSQDFFIISAGLDLAAPNRPPAFISAEAFYQQGFLYKPEALAKINGLGSHSYPNHGFIGSAEDTGKTSIRGYQWELSYLNSLGFNQNLPVFITETGWPHQEGGDKGNYYPAEKTAQLIQKAFSYWNQDPRIVAVTPFILNYPHGKFAHFSWLNQDQKPYPQLELVQQTPKQPQSPPQKEKIVIKRIEVSRPFSQKAKPLSQTKPQTDSAVPEPSQKFSNSGVKINGKLTLINQGQSIWGDKSPFCLGPEAKQPGVLSLSTICLPEKVLVEPNQEACFDFEMTLDQQSLPVSFGWEKTGKVKIEKLPNFLWGRTIYPYQRSLLGRVIGFLKHLRLKSDI